MTKKLSKLSDKSLATAKCGLDVGNITQLPAKPITDEVQLINPNNKKLLLKQLCYLRNKLNLCIKLVSQNRLDSKKLGSQSALKQQTNAISKRVGSIEDQITQSIIKRVKKGLIPTSLSPLDISLQRDNRKGN